MAKSGDVVQNGNLTITFQKTSADTGGAFLEVEALYAPRSSKPPLHVHPSQAEHFEVRTGLVRFVVAGVVRDVRAGEDIAVPPMTSHQAWNPEDGEARVVWRTTPAGETEQFFETLARLAQRGLVDERGRPSIFHVALLARRFRATWRLSKPPALVQSCLFGVLAPVARLRGLSLD